MTNFEKIKNMSVEELTNFLNGISDCCDSDDYNACDNCPLTVDECSCDGIKLWLESEAEHG